MDFIHDGLVLVTFSTFQDVAVAGMGAKFVEDLLATDKSFVVDSVFS